MKGRRPPPHAPLPLKPFVLAVGVIAASNLFSHSRPSSKKQEGIASPSSSGSPQSHRKNSSPRNARG